MEKLKVSEDIKEELDKTLKGNSTSKENLIIHHVKNGWEYREKLNNLSLDEFIRAIYFGYELEKTSEEKLADIYNKVALSNFDEGRNFGIELTLEATNKKIKGINA